MTGFKTDEYDKAAGCYIVRDRDAHAWTEVYTPGQGWVSFDPTSSHVAIETRSWYASLGLLWDQVQFYWYNLVVGYDSAARGELGKAIAAKVNLAWNGIFGVFQSIRSGMFNLLVEGYMDVAMFRLMIAIAAGGILVELMLMIRWQKRKGRRKKEQALLASQPWGELTFVNDLLDRICRQGLKEGGLDQLRDCPGGCCEPQTSGANLERPGRPLLPRPLGPSLAIS